MGDTLLFFCLLPLAFGFAPFFGFEELAKPAYDDGRFARQNFKYSHPNGGSTKLEYSVERTDKFILHLDSLNWVESVVCNEDNLRIFGKIDSNIVKNLKADALVVGGPHWKCLDSHSHLSILRVVVNLVSEDSDHIQLSTKPASHLHFFKNAWIDFYTDTYPQDQFMEFRHDAPNQNLKTGSNSKPSLLPDNGLEPPSKTYSSPDPSIKRWNWFADQLSKGWQQIKELAKQVTTIVKNVTNVIRAIATGTYSYSNTFTGKAWSWNLNSNGSINRTAIPIDSYLSCVNCFADSSYAITFRLGISNYQLSNLTVVLDGSATYQMGISAYSNGFWSGQAETWIATINMPSPITVVIAGVPIVIHVTVPIYVGYEVNLYVAAYLDFLTRGTGSLRFGFEYLNSKWNWIGKSEYTQSGGLNGITVYADVQAIAYLKPVVVFNIEYIGGPNVGLKPFFEFVADYGANDCGYLNFLVDTAWGFELSIGAQVQIAFPGGITIYNKTWDPTSILSVKRPLITGCAFYQNDGLPTDPRVNGNTTIMQTKIKDTTTSSYVYFYNDGFFQGTTWTAVQTRISNNAICLQYPPYLQFSMQIMNSYFYGDYIDVDYFASSDYGTVTADYACTTETLYAATIYPDNYVYLQVWSTTLDYKNCTPATTPKQAYVYQGWASSKLTTITLNDPNLCTQLVLRTDCGTCYIP